VVAVSTQRAREPRGEAQAKLSRPDERDAVRIAQDEMTRLGLPWREPHLVRRGWRWWRILTPSDSKPGTLVLVSRTGARVKVRHYTR
jgi:hypothetical protein